MIGMPGQNCHGAIELFHDKRPHDLVRQRHRPEGKAQGGPRDQIRRQPVRAADQEMRGRLTGLAPRAKLAGESLAGQRRAALIKHDPYTRSDTGKKRRALLGLAVFRATRAGFGNSRRSGPDQPSRGARSAARDR